MKPSVASTAERAQNLVKISRAFSILVPSLGGDVPKKNDGRAGFFNLLRKSSGLWGAMEKFGKSYNRWKRLQRYNAYLLTADSFVLVDIGDFNLDLIGCEMIQEAENDV